MTITFTFVITVTITIIIAIIITITIIITVLRRVEGSRCAFWEFRIHGRGLEHGVAGLRV